MAKMQRKGEVRGEVLLQCHIFCAHSTVRDGVVEVSSSKRPRNAWHAATVSDMQATIHEAQGGIKK